MKPNAEVTWANGLPLDSGAPTGYAAPDDRKDNDDMDEHVEAALMEAGARINTLVANERRLIDELAALRKDAERLDYIAGNARCDPKMDGQHVWWPTSFNHRLTGPTLRDAIDAAMGPKRDGAA